MFKPTPITMSCTEESELQRCWCIFLCERHTPVDVQLCTGHWPVHLLVGLVALVEGVPVDDVPVAVGQHAPKIVRTFRAKGSWNQQGQLSPLTQPVVTWRGGSNNKSQKTKGIWTTAVRRGERNVETSLTEYSFLCFSRNFSIYQIEVRSATS